MLADQEEEVIDLLSEEFEDEWRYRNIKNPVATTWLISFERIQHQHPLAAEYLSFMACIDRKEIPQFLLPAGLSRKKEIDAIGTLDAYSFIIQRPTDLSVSLHRLVHLATRNWLRRGELLARRTEAATKRLNEVFPDNDHKNRGKWRPLLPHARYVLASDLVPREDESRLALAFRYAWCLSADGWYNEAELSLQEVMEVYKNLWGDEHPDTLLIMANMVQTYNRQGRWSEAEELGVRVVEARKRILGEEYSETLSSMIDLASAYMSQCRWKMAEELQARVTETRRRLLGDEHLGTLVSMTNLAITYYNQDRLKEAEELEVQVMKTRKKILGEKHPETLNIMGNLAGTYWSQGRRKEAEELETQVMEARKRVLGEEHPSTLNSMSSLAVIWKSCGRDTEALQLLTDTLRLMRTRLGDTNFMMLRYGETLEKWTMV